MSVKAKFKVESVTDFGPSMGKQVRLRAVSDDGIPENQRYHKYTPSGEITLSIDNPSAADQFIPGKAFYVDFTSADQPVALPAAGLGNHPVSIPLEVAFPQTAD